MIERETLPGLDSYRQVVGDRRVSELYRLAQGLRGLSVVHVSPFGTGDGISEILERLVPLLAELGLESRWEVLKTTEEQQRAARRLSDAIQGDEVEFSSADEELVNAGTVASLTAIPATDGVVIAHDPGALGMIAARREAAAPGPHHGPRFVWQCHLDASAASPRAWRFVEAHLRRYDAAIFSSPHFARAVPVPQFSIPPSIDPLSPKNGPLPPARIARILQGFGLDTRRPIVLQVGRFDRHNDPLGVVLAYRMVRESNDCQLVIAGSVSPGDPDAAQIMDEVRRKAGDDPDVHLLVLRPGSHLEVNALQRGATVVLQKSIREGFALAVSEALWKGKPVVGSAVGGIPLQVLDGINGFLVSSPDGAAFRIRYLLNHPDVLADLGRRGIDTVRQNFLLIRSLRDHLMLLHALEAQGQRRIEL